MPEKTTVSFRVDSDLKDAAEEVCRCFDVTLSQQLRRFLRNFVSQNPPMVSPDQRLRDLEALERKNLLNKVTRQELAFLRQRR